ncbi:MAG: flagellar biosynthetic protein FliQ [Bdellovibrionota bacterium]|jgi:type III secretion protein S
MEVHELIQEALRILFLINFPLIIGVLLVGTIASTLMAATSVQEQSASYALRLITVLVILYFLCSPVVSWIMDLATKSLS